MALAGEGSKIWFDALSIDQSDHHDISSQVSVMGNIYGNAQSVVVLLPPSDHEAYATLKSLTNHAKALLNRRELFNPNSLDHCQDPNEYGRDVETAELCKQFYAELQKLAQDLENWVCWRRAWTFQEWAMARELHIALDGTGSGEVTEDVKSSVFEAGLMLARYKLKEGQYAKIDLGFSSGYVIPLFNIVKRLFPFEGKILSPEELSNLDLHKQSLFPSLFGTNDVLGIRGAEQSDIPDLLESRLFEAVFRTNENHCGTAVERDDILDRFRARLSMTLNVFGSSKVEAWLEADLVCCWASMCDIEYDHDENDTFSTALQKVLTEIRERGVKIYNFLVNTDGASGEVDLQFLDYAVEQPQCNSTNGASFPGVPIFTGRADRYCSPPTFCSHTTGAATPARGRRQCEHRRGSGHFYRGQIG